MNESSGETSPWLHELQVDVQRQFERQQSLQCQEDPLWDAEIAKLEEQSRGYLQSLGNPHLSPVLRQKLDEEYGTVLERILELESHRNERMARQAHAAQLVGERDVLERLQRLSDVLAGGDPTFGNIELALHIERIDCFHDERVVMKTCKLRGLYEVVDLLVDAELPLVIIEPESDGASVAYVANPRRRARRRFFDHEHGGAEARAMADFAADPNRFAGLGQDWFWVDEFTVPKRQPSWAAEHAEEVFHRRQKTKLSYAKLSVEFGVTPPTIKAAIKYFEATHPEEYDQVKLRAGGKRGPRIDVGRFAEEARQLWVGGWTKERLAKKYGCSTPVIDKALRFAYANIGLPMPTRKTKRNARVAEARRLLDGGASLDEIVAAMNVSDVTARDYLKSSFVAESKTMPDMRRRKNGLG